MKPRRKKLPRESVEIGRILAAFAHEFCPVPGSRFSMPLGDYRLTVSHEVNRLMPVTVSLSIPTFTVQAPGKCFGEAWEALCRQVTPRFPAW